LQFLTAVGFEVFSGANANLFHRLQAVGDKGRAHHGDPFDTLLGQLDNAFIRVRTDPRIAAQPRLKRYFPLIVLEFQYIGDSFRGRHALGAVAVAVDMDDLVAAIFRLETVTAVGHIALRAVPLGDPVKAHDD